MDNFPHLPTLLSVAVALVLLVFILNRWLFGPLNAILERRKQEIDSAREGFEEAKRQTESRLAEIEAILDETRREAHEIREQAQTAGRELREAELQAARQDAMAQIDEAKAEIASEVARAKEALASEADGIARSIAERLLGRPVGTGGDS